MRLLCSASLSNAACLTLQKIIPFSGEVNHQRGLFSTKGEFLVDSLAIDVVSGERACFYGIMELKDRIEQSRRKLRYSQAKLAALTGTKQNGVHRWEKGETSPSLDQIIQIAQACEVDPAWLAFGSPSSELITADEQVVLDLLRALRLSKDEALRRLAQPTGFHAELIEPQRNHG